MKDSIIGLTPVFYVFKLKDSLVENDAGDWGLEPNYDSIKVIRSTNFSNQGRLFLDDIAYRSLSKSKKKEKLLKAGDILIERSGGSNTQPVGRVGFIDTEISKQEFVFANFIQRIRIDKSIFYSQFVYYCLQQMYEMGITSSMQFQTTGIRNLDYKYYLKSKLPKPTIEEQKAIAGILSKVDEAIEEVENSIKAAERLKKSLMQNLLAGKLKPDGTWRSEDDFYVDEKFGKVPKGWEVKRVREISFNFDSQRKPIKAEDRKNISGTFPYYGAAGIIDWVNDYIFDGEYILFGEDGNNLLSRKVSQAFLVKGKFWSNNHAHVIQANPEFTTNQYLCDQLESKDYRPIIYGSAQPKINKRDLNGIKVLVPDDITEQIKITDSIGTFTEHVGCLDKKKNSLINLKKSLMQNLLTGKVRVDVEKINKLLEEV